MNSAFFFVLSFELRQKCAWIFFGVEGGCVWGGGKLHGNNLIKLSRAN